MRFNIGVQLDVCGFSLVTTISPQYFLSRTLYGDYVEILKNEYLSPQIQPQMLKRNLRRSNPSYWSRRRFGPFSLRSSLQILRKRHGATRPSLYHVRERTRSLVFQPSEREALLWASTLHTSYWMTSWRKRLRKVQRLWTQSFAGLITLSLSWSSHTKIPSTW